MIHIRLNSNVFNLGGLFYNVPSNRAVLHAGDGRNDCHLGKNSQVFPVSGLSWRGGQHVLLIDSTGTFLEDIEFQYLTHSDTAIISYANQLVTYLQRGVIEILFNGVPLTPKQVRDFVAP